MSFEHAGLRAVIGKLSASAALALAAGLLMAPAPSYADHTDDDDHEKVCIAHQTGSGRVIFIMVGAPAADHGHGQHDDVVASEAQCDDARDDARDDEDKEKKEKDKSDDGDDDENEVRGRGHGRGHGAHPGRGRGHGGPGR